MSQFRPFAYINTRPRLVLGKTDRHFETSLTKTYSTYRELKKDLPNLFSQSEDGEVRVYRSRRGQWGEWYEMWEGGKIVYESWM